MNCKRGDLAYQVYAGSNCGRVYEVLSVNCDSYKYGRVWNVRATKPIETFDSDNGSATGFKTDFECPDDWLRPISGVPVEDEVTEEIGERV
jgi:hypothetical protein